MSLLVTLKPVSFFDDRAGSNVGLITEACHTCPYTGEVVSSSDPSCSPWSLSYSILTSLRSRRPLSASTAIVATVLLRVEPSPEPVDACAAGLACLVREEQENRKLEFYRD